MESVMNIVSVCATLWFLRWILLIFNDSGDVCFPKKGPNLNLDFNNIKKGFNFSSQSVKHRNRKEGNRKGLSLHCPMATMVVPTCCYSIWHQGHCIHPNPKTTNFCMILFLIWFSFASADTQAIHLECFTQQINNHTVVWNKKTSEIQT